MRSRVYIHLPSDEAADMCESTATSMAAVDPEQILADDLRRATERFEELRRRPVTALALSESEAEQLLAECDAVFGALDPARVHTAELAVAVEEFRAFRTIVHSACSGAPSTSAVRTRHPRSSLRELVAVVPTPSRASASCASRALHARSARRSPRSRLSVASGIE